MPLREAGRKTQEGAGKRLSAALCPPAPPGDALWGVGRPPGGEEKSTTSKRKSPKFFFRSYEHRRIWPEVWPCGDVRDDVPPDRMGSGVRSDGEEHKSPSEPSRKGLHASVRGTTARGVRAALTCLQGCLGRGWSPTHALTVPNDCPLTCSTRCSDAGAALEVTTAETCVGAVCFEVCGAMGALSLAGSAAVQSS